MKEENNLYLFDEKIDEMKKTLDNLNLVIQQQTVLIELVEKSDVKEMLGDFVKDSKSYLPQILKQRDDLSKMKTDIESLLAKVRGNKEKEELLLEFAYIFGLFKKPEDTVEEIQ